MARFSSGCCCWVSPKKSLRSVQQQFDQGVAIPRHLTQRVDLFELVHEDHQRRVYRLGQIGGKAAQTFRWCAAISQKLLDGQLAAGRQHGAVRGQEGQKGSR
jgi:hypothetical protein